MLDTDEKHIIIQEILPGSPAASQGIKVGDRVLAVAQDREPAIAVDSSKLAQVAEMVHGPEGTPVRLTIVPAGEQTNAARTVTVVRAIIKPPPY